MSTSALISVRSFCEETQDYKVKTAYLSHDGRIAGTPHAAGTKLLRYYDTLSSVLELVALGGISAIGETPEKCHKLQDYEPVENWGRYARTNYDHIEYKYIFVADVSAWFVEYEYPNTYKKEYLRLDYVVRKLQQEEQV